MILKSQKSFRSMRNPVRPPVGFFNRRLSTRQNSNSDKVSRHFHFLHLLWLSLSCLLLFYFHFHHQSPRTPNRSASTTDVESHTESDAERGEVTLVCLSCFLKLLFWKISFETFSNINWKGLPFFRHPTKAQFLPPLLYLSLPPRLANTEPTPASGEMLQPENLDQLLFNRDCKLSKNVQGVFQAPLCEPRHALVVPPSRNPRNPGGWIVNILQLVQKPHSL